MIFILNPISGNGRKNAIIAHLEKNGHKVVRTEYAGHAEIIARETESDIVVAVGGDGTVNEVARGIAGTHKTLGIIPCGSGDGLALHLGISRNYRTALKTVLAGRTVSMDAATINGRPFFSVCGIGFDAVVSERFAKSGKRGLLSYIEQGLKTWREYAPDKYIIRIDGQEWTNDAALITVGNSNQWGNGAKITPHADISDGLLDVTIVDMFNAIEMPELARLLMTGHLDNYSKVHCYKGKNISIIRSATGPAHADGDWFVTGETIDISINPHALKVIVP